MLPPRPEGPQKATTLLASSTPTRISGTAMLILGDQPASAWISGSRGYRKTSPCRLVRLR